MELNVINTPYDIITQGYKYDITSQEKENIYHSIKSTAVDNHILKSRPCTYCHTVGSSSSVTILSFNDIAASRRNLETMF